MKLVLLVESALFSLLVLLGDDATNQLVGGFVVSMIFFVVALLSRPYEEDTENYSDIIARSCVCATLMLGLIVQASGPAGVDVVLIIISCVTTLWFLYTIDIREILLSRFFLLLQLYAQAKAARYTKAAIRKMNPERVRRIANSPIEFHVLSAVQRIHFATLHKEAFFGGKRITELADLGVTWLDLQQMDYTCASLRALGFSTDELMNVDAQLDDMGDRSDIQTLYEDVYLERKANLGEKDRSTLAAMHHLGALFRDMGEHVKGMEYAISCYKMRVKFLGPEDEDSLLSQQFIGEYYVQLNRAADGLEYLQSCHSMRCKTSEESEETLDVMRALGKCFQAVGMTGEALNILEKRYVTVVKLTMAEKLRRDHPRTLGARLDFANALADSGRYTSVPDLRLHAIMNRQKTIHGADNPETLKYMDRYAELCTKMGAHQQALSLNTEAVSEKAATLGPNHTGTIASKFALAATLIELGRNMEMQQLKLEDCLHDQETRLGETHPSTVSSTVKLAALYNVMGKYEDSLALFKTAYDVRCKSLGKEHELTLGVANNLAATYDCMERYQESKDMYESTLNILIAGLGKAHLSTTGVMLNLGQLYQRTGNLDKARQFYKDTYDLCMEAYGEKHPRTLMAYDFIGCLALIENRYQDAHDIFEKGMALRNGIYEESHPLCLATLENLASCTQRLGRKEEAIPLYKKLVQLRETGFGVRHIDTIKSRAGMAIVLAELGNVQEALNTMIACVQDTTAVLGPAAAQVQEYMGVIGYIYALCGQWDEGIRYTNMSLSGTIKIYGENHFLVKTLLQRKAWMLQSCGRIAEATQVTGIMNAIPSSNDSTATAGAAGSAPDSAAQAGSTSTAAVGSAAAAASAVADSNATMSPLQQQLQAEAAVEQNAELQITAILNQVIQVVQSGQMPAAVPMIQELIATYIDKIRDPKNILLVANLAAYVLNGGQPAVALTLMQKLYPIVEANFRSYHEILLPCMDLLGKAHAYSGNVPAAVPILEEYIALAQKDLKPKEPNPTLQQTQDLMVKLYGSLRQFDKAIGIYTSQFEYYRDTEGEASEPAITAINNRAMYWFALKNFENSRKDHKEVIRLLTILQGADHPETIQSVEGFKTLYASNGMVYE